jgi:hypothetical protein
MEDADLKRHGHDHNPASGGALPRTIGRYLHL